MKKYILSFCIFLVVISVIYTRLNKLLINNNGEYFYVIEGDNYQKNNYDNIKTKIIYKNKSKYNAYFGITKDKLVLNKLLDIYKDDGYMLTYKELLINNLEFIENVREFDKLINNTNDSKEVLTIEEVVLANYEEILKKSSKN